MKARESALGMYDSDEVPSTSNLEADEILWTNPVPDLTLPIPNGASKDQVNVPEGLSLVGKLLDSRDNVVFVHGWASDGSAENFLYPSDWQNRGFNTFIFRWHRDAQGSLGKAESAIWTSACEKGANSLAKLADTLPTSNQAELRLVGHSLGTQMVTCMATRFKQLRPFANTLRVELLDPWISPGSSLPNGVTLPGAKPRENTYRKIDSLLKNLRTSGAGLVDYSSITGGMSAANLYTTVHFQAMSGFWLSGNLLTRHSEMRSFYFESLSQKIPPIQGSSDLAFSARTPTEEIISRPLIRLIQVGGERSVSISDDIYRVKR